MASVNKVTLIGNVTRDPELRFTPKGTALIELGLAINRNYTTEGGEKVEEVTFVDITFWGRQAEVLGRYIQKGRSLYVEGRLQLDSWQDDKSGQKRSKLRVVGDSFQFLGGQGPAGGTNRDEDGESSGTNYSRQPSRSSPRSEEPQRRGREEEPRGRSFEEPEDDIPF